MREGRYAEEDKGPVDVKGPQPQKKSEGDDLIVVSINCSNLPNAVCMRFGCSHRAVSVFFLEIGF